MTIQPITFHTKKISGEIVKGIDKGGLYGLMKHNNREEYLNEYEIKNKRCSHIDKSKEHLNHYFKKMSSTHIEKLKSIPHRANQRGAFQIVISYQDLDKETASKFYNKEYAKKNAKLIIEFLKAQGITDRFELLDFSNHNDEGLYGDTHHPHFHLTFSAYDKIKKDWGYKDFFCPTVDKKPIIKNGEIQYKKVKCGKNRGEYILDTQDRKVPKLKDVEAPIFQKLQDDWNDFLIYKNQPFRNKKEFTSILQFPNSIWRKFDEALKIKIYDIRKLEKKMNILRSKGCKEKYNEIKKQLVLMFNDVLIETENIKKSINHSKTPK